MKLIRSFYNLRPEHQGCVATIGAFDGVHQGHRALLEQLVKKGKELGLPSVVVLFEPLPREYFSPLEAPARLTNFRERFVALQQCGIDRVLRIPFTGELSQMSAEDFVDKVFVAGLGVQYLVVGDDLRFGHERAGDYALLKSGGERHGFEVVDMSTLMMQGERVSSTRIRDALAQADFDMAKKLLGRPYEISGKVVYGQQLGAKLNAPTANLELHRSKAALSGVYAVEVVGLGDRLIPSIANVGTRPSVDNSTKAILEIHLLDFNANLYGKRISVRFHHKIRDEKKFDSLDELKVAIHTDIQVCRKYFGLTLT